MERYGFRFLIALSILPRLFRLTGPLDEPHSWRQADTANYALDFYRNGFDFLHPTVCWNGNQSALILEFPLYEAVVAGFYYLFGEQLLLARIVTLAFWFGSAVYLYRLVELESDRYVAQWTALVYSILPLGLFYSRAAHIDFSAVFFAHGMAYHFLAAAHARSKRQDLILSGCLGTLAFLIKAPYAFCLYLPLLLYAIRKGVRWTNWPALLAPPIVFLIWRSHVNTVNSHAPDLFFIPGYFKFLDLWGWYFGEIHQRFVGANWMILWNRFFTEAATPTGMLLAFGGLILSLRSSVSSAFLLLWLIATICYLFLFFPLNVIHNYYQIPFLPVISLLIARCLQAIRRMKSVDSENMRLVAVYGLVFLLGTQSLLFANRMYYKVDWIRFEAGRIIREKTKAGDLVIASISDTDPRDPRLLYASRRHGFSIRLDHLSGDLIRKLAAVGATHLTIILRPQETLETKMPGGYQFKLMRDGSVLGTLLLFPLQPNPQALERIILSAKDSLTESQSNRL